MLYSILIYAPENQVEALTQAEDNDHVARHVQLQEDLAAQGRLGPVVRLTSTATAKRVRAGKNQPVIDGPFAETKEQLLGFYVVDCASIDEALDIARSLPSVDSLFEVRPVRLYFPDRLPK
jgi:hypothetical protein